MAPIIAVSNKCKDIWASSPKMMGKARATVCLASDFNSSMWREVTVIMCLNNCDKVIENQNFYKLSLKFIF
jgi:hypothetical protein